MPGAIRKLLVANRGEIAVRIMRTCREMGIGTVAVWSDADRGAPHVLRADESVALGDPEPRRSYLDVEKIVRAAREKNADAIHPGYGFLAENADFAERCRDENLIFVGPTPEAIRAMGDKVRARRLAADAGVPVIPGMLSPGPADAGAIAREAGRIGFPVIIKATLGGGGKGMRIVGSPGELEEALVQCGAEAAKAFGDGSVYVEKHLRDPRHVEFQVLADAHGSAVHLGERECSIQRRHQKIVEESPSPALTEELRKRMAEATLAIVRAAGYRNAGTVEFMVAEGGAFYFLEMNTRIQVEHPVTELRTGLDLVRTQIEIAAGERLGLRQEDIRPSGHAVECRIYAEDPSNGFLPCPGKILALEEPAGPGVRVDSGIAEGMTVPMDYDPILSKLITHAPGRPEALGRMGRALREYRVAGIRTIIPFLIDVIESKPFREGETPTTFIEKHLADWRPGEGWTDAAAAAYVLHDILARRPSVAQGDAETPSRRSPWQTLGRWRL